MATNVLSEDILKMRGGFSKNSLLEILQNVEDIDTTIFLASESPYIDIVNVPHYVERFQDKFTLLNLNIQSINAKFDVFVTFLDELASKGFFFSVITLQESWLSKQEDVSFFNIPGYNCVALDASCSSHSGLITYIHNDFQYTNLNLYTPTQLWEGLFLEIYGGGLGKKITLCNIYRPPRDRNIDIDNFVTEISPILNSLSISHNDVIYAGDINIDLLKVENRFSYSSYLELLYSLSFLPCITLPTRLSQRNATLIDHIFYKSSSTDSVNSGIFISQMSDHLMTFSSFCPKKTHSLPPNTITFQVSDTVSMNKFVTAINNSSLFDKLEKNVNTDPTKNYDTIKSTIVDSIQQYLPMRTVKFNKYKHKARPWITYGIIKSIKNRDIMYRKLKCVSPETEEYSRLKINLSTYNSILKKSMRSAKMSYFHNIFSKYKTDSQKTWKVINSLINGAKNKKNISNVFVVNGKNLNNEAEIAEHFNAFFSTVGLKQASSIPHNNMLFSDYLLNPSDLAFSFTRVTRDEITQIINSFKPKSSTGEDNISLKLFKMIGPKLSESLTLVINQSLATGVFPDSLKIAKVIPLFKKDDASKFDNYRPISLLPCISKLFEKVAHKQLYSYFNTHKLLYLHQHGFRQGHSTETATLEFIDRILNLLDNSKVPFSIFIDLSKAFDTLDHNILLHKLSYYGICNTPLKWFQSYLSNRIQYVNYHGSISDAQTTSIGVPQGSVLGPLLFLIYINDINSVSPFFQAILYADDTTLTSTLCCFNDNISVANKSDFINNELDKIYKWLCSNRLSLNIKKTTYMIFHAPQKVLEPSDCPTLKINNVTLSRATEFNFLGTLISDTLSWKPHISALCKKLSRTIGIMRRLKNTLPSRILLSIYNSIFLSYIHQSVLVWGHECPERILKLQKKAIRVIFKCKYNAHTDPLFKINKLLKFSDIYNVAAMKFYYKYSKSLLPAYFQNMFSNEPVPHDHFTRQSQPRIQISKKKFTSKCIRYIIPKLHKTLPPLVTQKTSTHSLNGFSNYIKNYYCAKYTIDCAVVNCYICENEL